MGGGRASSQPMVSPSWRAVLRPWSPLLSIDGRGQSLQPAHGFHALLPKTSSRWRTIPGFPMNDGIPCCAACLHDIAAPETPVWVDAQLFHAEHAPGAHAAA